MAGCAICLPWDIFDLLHRTGHWHLVHPSDDLTMDFWTDYMAQDFSFGHSVYETSKYHPLGKTTALHVHIDGVKVYKGSGFGSENLVYSLSGALSHGRKTRFVLGQLPLWLMNKETNSFVINCCMAVECFENRPTASLGLLQ